MKRITFERTGGFMGRKISLALDLDELPTEQAQTLDRLLDEADFFNLADDLLARPMPDEFTYTITVEAETQSHTMRLSDTTAPDSLRPLLEDLSRLARTWARQKPDKMM